MARQETFKSMEEVIKRYWPKELQQPEDSAPTDPVAAGEALGRRVVETFGRELVARLAQLKSNGRSSARPSVR